MSSSVRLLPFEGVTVCKISTGLDDAHATARRAYERAGFSIQRHDVTHYKKNDESPPMGVEELP